MTKNEESVIQTEKSFGTNEQEKRHDGIINQVMRKGKSLHSKLKPR